jgi:hypothetical protein
MMHGMVERNMMPRDVVERQLINHPVTFGATPPVQEGMFLHFPLLSRGGVARSAGVVWWK